MAFDVSFLAASVKELLAYLPVTLILLLASVFWAGILGLVLTVGQLAHFKWIQKLVIGFLALMRGTPMLLLILFVYYGLPVLLAGSGLDVNQWKPEFYAICAISINSSAYFSEAMRSAYLAVSKGQMEAGLSVGMKKGTIVRRIIIPQAAVTALPNLQNQVIGILKHTALVYAIGITDVYQKGQVIAGSTYGLRQLEVFIGVTIVYWALCILIELLFSIAEKRRKYLC